MFYNTVTCFVQGYTAAVRLWYNRGNLHKWMVFLQRDFDERNDARITFEKRHLPLSDGRPHPEFGGLLKVPDCWSNPEPAARQTKTKTQTQAR